MKRAVAIVGALCLLTLGSAPAMASVAPNDYLSVGRSEVAFVELTVSGSDVVGVMYTDTMEGSSPNTFLESGTVSLGGTDNDGSLTLYLDGGTTFGTLKGQTLSLQEQENGGTLVTVTFHRSSVTAYDVYVTQWGAAVKNGDAIASNLSAMSSGGNLSYDEASLATLVSNIHGVLATTDRYLRTDGICGWVSAGYRSAAGTNVAALIPDAKRGVGDDIRHVEQAMARLPGEYSAYWHSQHALRSYGSTTPIPPLSVALSRGQSVIDGAVSQVNSDINRVNSYFARTFQLANAANEAHHCGPLESAPVIGQVTAAALGA
jgi:hypothetical protein